MATKTITRYRTRTVRARGRRRAGFNIPLAVVGGFIPMIYTPAKMFMGGAWDAGMWHLVANTTGINKDDGKFMWPYFMKSWGPALAGIAVHKIIGQRLGVNAMLSRAGVPLFRI